MTGINNKNQTSIKTRKTCRICEGKNLHKFLTLGPTPLANSYIGKKQLKKPENFYPLDAYFCSDCYLVQLLDTVSPKVLFKNYTYLTGASSPMKVHFAKLANDTITQFKPDKNSLIIDIGSNDGTLLGNFLKSGFKKILGIEPAANVAELAKKEGVPTFVDFFNEKTSIEIRKQYGPAQIIIGTNVFAHNYDLEGFVRGIYHLLSENGVFVVEVPYLQNMLNNLEFDTIYHEHLSYFSFHPLVFLFNKFGMEVIDVKKVSVHGGTIRVFVQKKPKQQSQRVSRLLLEEKNNRLDSLKTYVRFAKRVASLKNKLIQFLKKLKKEKASIIGYGATAKSCTLLNYCGINSSILDYIVDTTPFKQGCYTPGTHIPIFPVEKFHKETPDYALLLAWNYADQIIKKEKKYKQTGGKFILPFPEAKIL